MSLSDEIVIAASSLASAVRPPEITQSGGPNAVVISGNTTQTPTKSTCTDTHRPIGLSPGKITDLRIKKIHELRELQQLLEQNILTEEEFAEQKSLVLSSLRKLTD